MPPRTGARSGAGRAARPPWSHPARFLPAFAACRRAIRTRVVAAYDLGPGMIAQPPPARPAAWPERSGISHTWSSGPPSAGPGMRPAQREDGRGSGLRMGREDGGYWPPWRRRRAATSWLGGLGSSGDGVMSRAEAPASSRACTMPVQSGWGCLPRYSPLPMAAHSIGRARAVTDAGLAECFRLTGQARGAGR